MSSANHKPNQTYDYRWGDGDSVVTSLCTSGRCRFTISTSAYGYYVMYGLRQWSFTLICRPDLMSEMSTDLPSNNSRITYGQLIASVASQEIA